LKRLGARRDELIAQHACEPESLLLTAGLRPQRATHRYRDVFIVDWVS